MLRSLYRTLEGPVRTDLNLEAFATVLKEPDSLLWVDFDGEPPEVCEPTLQQAFGFHPLAVDDALQESNVPKVDGWDTYLCVVLHAVTRGTADHHPPAGGAQQASPGQLCRHRCQMARFLWIRRRAWM